jgi:hypothetical protein
LTREATLVAAARSALARGQPAIALQTIRATRALPTRQLLPEELAVESQTLRALGRIEEARSLESDLRASYPESAFAR